MKLFTLLASLFALISCNIEPTRDQANFDNEFINLSFSNEINDKSIANTRVSTDFERAYIETLNLEYIINEHLSYLNTLNYSQIKWIVLYSKSKFSQYDDVFENQSTGISVFYVDSEYRFKHQLLQINGTEYQINNDFTSNGSTILLPKTLKSIAKTIDDEKLLS